MWFPIRAEESSGVRLQLRRQRGLDGASPVRPGRQVRRLVRFHHATSRRELAVGPRGPHRFRVVWGDSFRNVTQDIVLALDFDEALTVADGRRRASS